MCRPVIEVRAVSLFIIYILPGMFHSQPAIHTPITERKRITGISSHNILYVLIFNLRLKIGRLPALRFQVSLFGQRLAPVVAADVFQAAFQTVLFTERIYIIQLQRMFPSISLVDLLVEGVQVLERGRIPFLIRNIQILCDVIRHIIILPGSSQHLLLIPFEKMLKVDFNRTASPFLPFVRSLIVGIDRMVSGILHIIAAMGSFLITCNIQRSRNCYQIQRVYLITGLQSAEVPRSLIFG